MKLHNPYSQINMTLSSLIPSNIWKELK